MKLSILIFIVLIAFSCGDTASTDVSQNDRLELIPEPDKDLREAAEKAMKAEISEEEEYLGKEMKPIRQNFSRINHIEKWTTIEKKELLVSTEGGEAFFYFKKDSLLKIIAQHFGEMFKSTNEYYILDGKLSFVFEKRYQYNRPITWDSIVMLDNDDDEVFDFDKSEIFEDRSYFENEILIRQLSNKDSGSPAATEYLQEEQKRLQSSFSQLLELSKE